MFIKTFSLNTNVKLVTCEFFSPDWKRAPPTGGVTGLTLEMKSGVGPGALGGAGTDVK